MGKLTKAQRTLLSDLGQDQTYSAWYPFKRSTYRAPNYENDPTL